jgi:hypothetical protein
LSPHEQESFNRILIAKESPRHKELKNKIGNLLEKVDGVDKNSITIDNKFIIRDNEKRKPDVYCRYKDKEIVFEIQLSNLSLGYILSRYEFYKKNNIFLVWILDNFDIYKQGTLERDIKYLTKYENFFKLDETSNSFKLECEYKYSFLTNDNKLLSKWQKRSVSLDEIKFDNQDYQIYFYNFGDIKNQLVSKQKRKEEEIKKAEIKRKQEAKQRDAELKSRRIIEKIKELRKRKAIKFNEISKELFSFDDFDIKVFNSILNLKSKKAPLIKWIDNSEQYDIPFLDLILTTPEIELNVNEKDENGRTAFQAIFENNKIHKFWPIKSLFKANYLFTEKDKDFYLKLENIEKNKKKKKLLLYEICNRLNDRDLADNVFDFAELLYIIESAKHNKVIAYNRNPDDIVWLANNAIQFHNEYWEYIELSFKNFGLWNKIEQLDSKGSFEKKLKEFYSKMPEQKYDFDRLFIELYPEIYYER